MSQENIGMCPEMQASDLASCVAFFKKPILRGHILYDSIYITFRRKNRAGRV